METKLALLALALFVVFIAVRMVVTDKANKALNAAMKKRVKETEAETDTDKI
jgi:hypothetical protein